MAYFAIPIITGYGSALWPAYLPLISRVWPPPTPTPSPGRAVISEVYYDPSGEEPAGLGGVLAVGVPEQLGHGLFFLLDQPAPQRI